MNFNSKAKDERDCEQSIRRRSYSAPNSKNNASKSSVGNLVSPTQRFTDSMSYTHREANRTAALADDLLDMIDTNLTLEKLSLMPNMDAFDSESDGISIAMLASLLGVEIDEDTDEDTDKEIDKDTDEGATKANTISPQNGMRTGIPNTHLEKFGQTDNSQKLAPKVLIQTQAQYAHNQLQDIQATRVDDLHPHRLQANGKEYSYVSAFKKSKSTHRDYQRPSNLGNPTKSSNKINKNTSSLRSDGENDRRNVARCATLEASAENILGKDLDILHLPPDWAKFQTEDGFAYYYNYTTQQTTWEFPKE